MPLLQINATRQQMTGGTANPDTVTKALAHKCQVGCGLVANKASYKTLVVTTANLLATYYRSIVLWLGGRIACCFSGRRYIHRESSNMAETQHVCSVLTVRVSQESSTHLSLPQKPYKDQKYSTHSNE